jgi:Succinylglutamate desuccinylase / Aspartoacylase family
VGVPIPKRLGKNSNGYLGETIDLNSVLRDCFASAKTHGWKKHEIPVNQEISLAAFIRPGLVTGEGTDEPARRKPSVYISTGIHGDEPAGPLAIRQLLHENKWPQGFGLWVCPCLNPTGFIKNTRESASGVDLNREYLQPQAPETIAHINWLSQQPTFDLCLCLHEDWESHGFYVYELNPDNQPSLAEGIVKQVAEVCPIDTSELIEGRPASNGIIRPSIDPRDRPQWPESFYLLTHKTKLSYTLEAPSDFPLESRVAALVAGVRSALEILDQRLTRITSA